MLTWNDALRTSVDQIPGMLFWMLMCAVVFFALAIGVKGLKRAVDDGRAAAEEIRINAILSAVDQFTVGPLLAIMAAAGGVLFRRYGLQLDEPQLWTRIGWAPTLFATVFVGDFIGYWRHRLQHSALLWPAHAIHHSDRAMTWFTLERMHPIDRIGSMGDTILLGALGFPPWALLANVAVRHYYGYLIHADVPWTLGKANLLFNSPAMHRWHHARDITCSGSNFATVFSVFDRLFGTYYQPGPCDVPLGVNEDMGRGVIGQYLYPLRVWLGLEPTPAAAPKTAKAENTPAVEIRSA